MTTTGLTLAGVSLTIDQRKVNVAPGTLIIEAAKSAGITVPHFCYHERLKPIAACRLCLVEIEGVRGLQASCATPVKEGMVVRTNAAAALDSHKEVLDQVLREHPLDCPKCEAAGCCQLEDFTYEFGPHRVSFYTPPGLSGVDYQEEKWSPLISFDKYKCVECLRCVRVCDEIHDCGALTIDGRGHRLTISTFAHGPLHCDHCASCVSVCPTGAITQEPARYWKKDWEYERRPAICGHCGHGCSLVLRTWEEKIGKVDDNLHLGINRANLCAKGRFGFDMLDVPARVRAPMVRRGGVLEETDWNTALDEAAKRMKEPGELAGLASGILSVEDLFVFRKLVTGSNGTVASDSCDGELSRNLHDRTGSWSGNAPFDSIKNYRTIVCSNLDDDDLDYVGLIEIIAAHRQRGAMIWTIGETCPRLARYGVKKIASEDVLKANCLYVLNGEQCGRGLPDKILEDVVKEPSNGILLLSAQANSRGLGPLGYGAMRDHEPKAATILVAGPVNLERRPKSCRSLIVSATYLEGIALEADVVFPAAMAYEKPGHYINAEGRMQSSAAAVRPQGLAWPDAALWSHLAARLGLDVPATPRAIMDAAAAEIPDLGAVRERFETLRPAGSPPEAAISRLKKFPRHHGPMLEHSQTIKTMQTHLDASKEYSPWAL